MDDMQLLRRYAECGCQKSFEKLVSRHINWVYAMCLRGVRDKHLAEDVTQAVFIILSRKAKTLHDDTVLRGWLFKTSRFAVADAIKKRSRHRKHTERALALFPVPVATSEEERAWDEITPLLDEALACLSEKDRQAIMLRFYESKSLAEVGAIMTISEEAAKKRVARAVERLRTLLSREGAAISASLLLAILTTESDAAPFHLASTITTAANANGIASGMASAIAHGATKGMIKATGRLVAALTTGVVAALLLAGGFLFQLLDQPSTESIPLQPIAIKLPDPREQVKHIWLGTRDDILWQFHKEDDQEHPTPALSTLKEQSPQKLYAIAVDRDGQTWIRQLSREILASTLSTYESLEAGHSRTTPAATTDEMLAVLLADVPTLASAGGGGSGMAGGSSFISGIPPLMKPPLGPPSSPFHYQDPLLDQQWHSLPSLIKDGSLAIDEIPVPGDIRFDIEGIFDTEGLFNLDGNKMQNFFDPVMVPEPLAPTLLLLASAALLRRRRPTSEGTPRTSPIAPPASDT